MKNRNVIFIGFVVAAVLNTSGAFAAYSIASKDYVDALGNKIGNGFDAENTVTAAVNGINTTLANKADADDLTALSNTVGTGAMSVNGAVQSTVINAINALDSKTNGIATDENLSELQDNVTELATFVGNADMGTTAESVTGAIAEHTTAIAGLETAVDAKQDTLVTTGNNANIVGSGSVTVSKDADTGVITINGTDNDTTYALGTAETLGLTKLYANVGENTDGTMTQDAIKTALDAKADSLPTQCTSESQFCVLTFDVQNDRLAWIEITSPFTEE